MPRTQAVRERREWTLMFYFASDNALAPGIVSHLKALKQAGFHPDANVVVHFDPNAGDEPAHVFDVNLVNKLRAGGKPRIGFSYNPPSVRNLAEDKLWDRDRKELIREALRDELGGVCEAYDPPETHAKMSDEQSPRDGLRTFLDFCRKHYPARRYMLFLLGHGLVMGHNMFLLDEHAPEPTMTLRDLGAVLRGFRRGLDAEGARFELVSFHCCSMSGLEVAYELQGTANYMLASQGPAFVGSWPYASIVVSVFNSIRRLAAAAGGAGRDAAASIIKALVKEIWSHCYLNSYDFQLVGYSFDLCLCDLNKVREIKTPLKNLSSELAEGLADPLARERILLAHWDAQSFWEDSYTDLYDFCFRLRQRCVDVESASEKSGARLRSIRERCEALMRVLASGDEQLVIRAEFTGPAYQFSHGLFVYFPWAEPGDQHFWLEEYGNYRFKETSWRGFLQQYFRDTMRQARGYERHPSEGFEGRFGLDEILLGNTPGRDFNCDAQQLGRGDFMSAKLQGKKKNVPRGAARPGVSGSRHSTRFTGKAGPHDPAGDGFGSSPIKNHPPSTSGVPARTGIRSGGPNFAKGAGNDATGDGFGSSPIKNYPSSTRSPVGEWGAKREGGKKEARGVPARTGIRAGQPSPADGKPNPSVGDGSGTSSVKNYPTGARISVGEKGAQQEGGKKGARGVAAKTGVRAGGSGSGKGGPNDWTGDGFGSSSVKNYPTASRAPEGERSAKQESDKKHPRGLAARTGLRAGESGKTSPIVGGRGKGGVHDPTGDGFGGSPVKNYPPVTRARRKR